MKKVIPCLFTSGNLCFGVLSMILSSFGVPYVFSLPCFVMLWMGDRLELWA